MRLHIHTWLGIRVNEKQYRACIKCNKWQMRYSPAVGRKFWSTM